MSDQLKEQQESIDQKVFKILEELTTPDTVMTIRNWLKSDLIRINDMITNLNEYLQYEDGKIDAKKYYELIESYRYTISIMEQAIIEA